MHSTESSVSGIGPVEGLPRFGSASFPKRGLTVDTRLGPTASAEGFGARGMVETGIGWSISVQDFLAGGGAIAIDS